MYGMTRKTYESPAREAAAAETRARIVAAAVAALRDPAGGSFSLEAVGKRAGVTRLTVYNHFGARRALLEAAFDAIAETSGLSGALATVGADPDPRRALRVLVDAFCDFWRPERGAHRSLQAGRAGDVELDDALAARNERRRRLLELLARRMFGARAGAASRDFVESVFVLTSQPVFAELSRGADAPTARRLIHAMVDDAARRAAGQTGG
jgi:AcrR family transcriptional regulator